MTPLSRSAISSSDNPVSSAMKDISTFAFSEMETARASEGVSTLVILTDFLIVRLVNISALALRLPSSSTSSKEHRR